MILPQGDPHLRDEGHLPFLNVVDISLSRSAWERIDGGERERTTAAVSWVVTQFG